ncbi:MAG: hypothetical protein RJA91_117 [Pseudomonadota bacterium]|jgi:hypothetical protein
MKIELIKEIDIHGKTWYYITKDGEYQSGTTTTNLEEAELKFTAISENRQATKEVIKQIEI